MRRRPARIPAGRIVLALFALCLASAVVSAAVAATPGRTMATTTPLTPRERQAVHTYLTATYAFAAARANNLPASIANVERVASRLTGECPNVLAGAPQERMEPPTSTPSPRQMGEEERQSRQRGYLLDELFQTISVAKLEPDRQAALAYAATLKSLHWRSDPTFTQILHVEAASLESELGSPPPDVCDDMRAWVTSGYRTLSPASMAYVRTRQAMLAPLRRQLPRVGAGAASPQALQRYVRSHEKTLVRQIRSLDRQQAPSLKALYAVEGKLGTALGIAEPPPPRAPERPAKGSVVVGRGKTAAGTTYTIRVEPQRKRSPREISSCAVNISVETRVTEEGFTGSSTGGGCLSRSHPEPPSVQCDYGTIVVEAQTRPHTRAVRLRLSNGRSITSSVALVPARLGGPVGFYYQAVRGPSPIPVALTELDARGKALRTVKLHHQLECTRNPIHTLPGGLRTIVRASVPGGPSFSIVGHRYRFQGRTHFKLNLEVGEGLEEGGEGGEGSSFLSGGSSGSPARKQSPLSWEIEMGCQPHQYAILYGVLKTPRDTALVRTARGLRPFKIARIPSSLHVRGVLAYVALDEVPSEVLIRSPRGKTLVRESLGSLPHETSERCQGEAEGPN